MPYVWIAVIIAAVIFEGVTTGALVAIWFVPAALTSMILAFCEVTIWIQLPVFIGLSIIFIFLVRPLFDRMRKEDTRTNIDAVIGERALVVERIENIAGCGQVKVRGQSWSARAVGDEVYESGTVLTVVAVEGVKLICKK